MSGQRNVDALIPLRPLPAGTPAADLNILCSPCLIRRDRKREAPWSLAVRQGWTGWGQPFTFACPECSAEARARQGAAR